MFFDLSTAELAILLVGATFGATAAGALAARRARHLSDTLTEPFGILQGALLGVVGLILAFGLSLALSRYEDRRATIVAEANAIGTTYLRAQLLPEPQRSRSLESLRLYARSADSVAESVPGNADQKAAAARETELQRDLWRQASEAARRDPESAVSRLYLETLNEMIDAQTVRIASLANRVPTSVLLLELLGACIALFLLAGYLTLVGRGASAVFLASGLVAFLLFLTADLDRPTRGVITVPDTVLSDQVEEMEKPPAAPPAPLNRR